MIKKEMIAMLLAGGQGSRLGVLTSKVAKPAVAFGGKYRILLNCGDYKENKYAKITALVNKLAQDVEESGVPTVLNPMPADERRVVHNVVLGFPDLESPSIGDGKERHIIIKKKRQ